MPTPPDTTAMASCRKFLREAGLAALAKSDPIAEPLDRRKAAREALLGAIQILSAERVSVAPLLEVYLGLLELDQGREPAIFKRSTQAGGQSAPIMKMVAIAYACGALEIKYEISSSTSDRSKLQRVVLHDIEKTLSDLCPDHTVDIDGDCFGIRNRSSLSDAEQRSRSCLNLERHRNTFSENRSAGHARTQWPQATYNACIIHRAQRNDAGSSLVEPELLYSFFILEAGGALLNSLLVPRKI